MPVSQSGSRSLLKEVGVLKYIIGILLFLVLLYVVSAIAITYLTFRNAYGPHKMDRYSAIAKWDFYQKDYSYTEVRFSSGDNQLAGYHFKKSDAGTAEQLEEEDCPDSGESREDSHRDSRPKKKGLIVFSHGIWSSPFEYLIPITWFLDQGWDVFSYSYASYDDSEGTWAKGLPQSVQDLRAALRYLDMTPEIYDPTLPRVLMGHSWGAYASTAVLRYGFHVDAAVAFSGFSDPVEISKAVGRNMIGPLGATMGWTVNLFNRILFHTEYRRTAVQGINIAEIPVMLIHGLNDGFIRYEKTSIVCHRDELKPKYIIYEILDNPLQSDHNNYFADADATAYYKEIEDAYTEIKKQYPKKNVPEDVQKAFFEKVDYERVSRPNEVLYKKVEAFLAVFVK